MAYNAKGLIAFVSGGDDAVAAAPGKTRTLYHYATRDSIATVVASGYFNNEASRLLVGDVIICSCAVDSTGTLTTVCVASNDLTTVTTAKTA